jgi:hypothetical protein
VQLDIKTVQFLCPHLSYVFNSPFLAIYEVLAEVLLKFKTSEILRHDPEVEVIMVFRNVITIYHLTRRSIPEDLHLYPNLYRSKNLDEMRRSK